jgi:hypothetical protein
MMDKNTTIVVVVGLLTIGVGYYFYTDTVNYHATQIAKSGKSSNLNVLLTFEKGYLKAWHKAIVKKQTTFTYNGKNYATQGGKQV